jgi:hypothetical protein
LTAGSSLFTAPVEAPVVGATVASLTSPFATPLFSGSLTSLVIAGDATNPYGGLTFVYILHNDIAGPNSLNRVTLNGFAGWLTDGSTDAGPGVAPISVDRDLTSNVVGFSFLSLLPGYTRITPGATSRALVVQTDAPFWTGNIGNVIDGAVTTAPILVPAIPTPGAAALLGLGGLMIARRRR